MIGRRGRGRKGAVTGALGAALLIVFFPLEASADVACSFDEATRVLTVNLVNTTASQPGQTVTISRDPVDEDTLLVRRPGVGGITGPCSEQTVFEVDTVVVNGTGESDLVVFDLTGGALEPGFSDETGNSDEIETELNFPEGNSDIRVVGGTAADSWSFGDLGINLNANEQAPDLDVALMDDSRSHVDEYRVLGAFGNDKLDGSGAKATGGANSLPFLASGSYGNDVIWPGDEDDNVDGGAGKDVVNYTRSSAGVTVDLLLADGQQAQPTVGSQNDVLWRFENIVGTRFHDVLKGDDESNKLSGAAGPDNLAGRGGNDGLDGGPGDDTCLGGAGVDTLTSC